MRSWARLGVTSLVGLLCMMEGPRSLTVKAATPVTVIVMTLEFPKCPLRGRATSVLIIMTQFWRQ